MKKSLLETMIIRGQKQLMTYIMEEFIYKPYSHNEVSDYIESYMQKYFDLVAERCLWYDEPNSNFHTISKINYSYNAALSMNGTLNVDIDTSCLYHDAAFSYEEFLDGVGIMLKLLFSYETYNTLVDTARKNDLTDEVLLCRKIIYQAFIGQHIFSIVNHIKSGIKRNKTLDDDMSTMLDTVSNALSWSDIVNTDSEVVISPVFQMENGSIVFDNATVYVNNR